MPTSRSRMLFFWVYIANGAKEAEPLTAPSPRLSPRAGRSAGNRAWGQVPSFSGCPARCLSSQSGFASCLQVLAARGRAGRNGPGIRAATPQVVGTELLPQIHQLPAYRATPIVILGSAPKERAEAHCLALGANAYFHKALNYYVFADDIKTIVQRWLRTVRA